MHKYYGGCKLPDNSLRALRIIKDPQEKINLVYRREDWEDTH